MTKIIIGRPLLWFLFQWRLNFWLARGWKFPKEVGVGAGCGFGINDCGWFGQKLLIARLEKEEAPLCGNQS